MRHSFGSRQIKPSATLQREVERTNDRDYDILDTYEAGMVLTGSEVKSLRAGRASIQEAYGRIRRGELWLAGATDDIRPAVVACPWSLLLNRRQNIHSLLAALYRG